MDLISDTHLHSWQLTITGLHWHECLLIVWKSGLKIELQYQIFVFSPVSWLLFQTLSNQKTYYYWRLSQVCTRTHLTHVVSTYGTGMLMTTSLSSRLSSCSSYSMLTSQPLPLSEGQQLTVEKQCSHVSDNEERNTTREQQHIKMAQVKHMCCHSLVRGMRDSSVVCNLHFSTPTSLLSGKDFSGFFRPTTDSAVNNFLSTLGCVWEDTDTIITTTVIMLLNPLLLHLVCYISSTWTLSFIIYY